MIRTETVEINGKPFEHVWSDEGRYLERDGQRWEEVYNPPNTGRTYAEGEVIEREGEPSEILDILLGGPDDND